LHIAIFISDLEHFGADTSIMDFTAYDDDFSVNQC